MCYVSAVKTAVIGAGRMGRRHIQVVQELGLDVAGVADPLPESLDACGKERGIPADRRFTDGAAMLKTVRPECVVVSTTAPTHAELVCLAAEAGAKLILCEKPMAISLAQCDRMIAACKQSGARLAINHQMRFMEQYTLPKALLDSPAFGGMSSLSVVAGNFGLAMNGSHYFEAFRFVAGEAPVEISAWFSAEKVANPRGAQFEDRAGVVVARTASGKRFSMDASTDQGHGMVVTYAARNGHLMVDELDGFLRVAVREEEHRALPTTRYGMPHKIETRTIAPADALTPTRAVMQALIADENYPTGADGRAAVAALVAAYVSNEKGHMPVAIDSGLPKDREFPWA